MQKKLLGYDQITRVFDPSYEQMSLSKFFEDPLNVYLLNEGTQVKVFDKGGRTIKAFAKTYEDGLILSCRLPCTSFQFGQKILIFIDVGSKSYALQTIIKSAHMGDLYVEDTSTRFYPRFKTLVRATACPLPAHYVSNIMEGKWFIERRTKENDSGRLRITDTLVDWKSSNEIENIRIDKQVNVLMTSMSQGGFAVQRNVTEDMEPLKHLIITCGYYLKGAFIQLELLAIARKSFVSNGVETVNCCLVSPLPQMDEDIFPHEKKVNLELSEKVEVYLNGDIKGHTDNINLLLPPGKHRIKLITRHGPTFEETIHIDSFDTCLDTPLNYHLFGNTPIGCVATETENDLVENSGI
ncbi:hypothetical protein N9W79_00690 [bacterium]|nr:hypothetical protein [bacterium]